MLLIMKALGSVSSTTHTDTPQTRHSMAEQPRRAEQLLHIQSKQPEERDITLTALQAEWMPTKSSVHFYGVLMEHYYSFFYRKKQGLPHQVEFTVQIYLEIWGPLLIRSISILSCACPILLAHASHFLISRTTAAFQCT